MRKTSKYERKVYRIYHVLNTRFLFKNSSEKNLECYSWENETLILFVSKLFLPQLSVEQRCLSPTAVVNQSKEKHACGKLFLKSSSVKLTPMTWPKLLNRGLFRLLIGMSTAMFPFTNRLGQLNALLSENSLSGVNCPIRNKEISKESVSG